jgi:hypothetical protein
MGFKAWSKLSVLLFASAALVGCTSGPQKTNNAFGQKSSPMPNGLATQNANQQAFPQQQSPFSNQPNGNLMSNPQQQRPIQLQPATGPGPGQVMPTPPQNLPPFNTSGFSGQPAAPTPFPQQVAPHNAGFVPVPVPNTNSSAFASGNPNVQTTLQPAGLGGSPAPLVTPPQSFGRQ